MDTGNKSKPRTPRPRSAKRGGQNPELRIKGTAIFFITNKGLALAKKLKGLYPDARVLNFKSGNVQQAWNKFGNLIFIMAAGIVVRSIAPTIKNKRTDPAVIVVDEKGRHAISLLSGHLGGANKLAKEIAGCLDGKAVITTASDINNVTSLDLWAKENNLVIDNWDMLPRISTKLLNNGVLKVYVQKSEVENRKSGIKLPEEFLEVNNPICADVLVTNKIFKSQTPNPKSQIYLRPQNLIIGIGCNSGTSEKEIEGTVTSILLENNLSLNSIKAITTLDKKKKEPGLVSFAKKHGIEITSFSTKELNSVQNVSVSLAAQKSLGVNAVSEPAALLASGNKNLLIPKQKIGNVTIAVALKDSCKSKNSSLITRHSSLRAKLYIVGTGPGSIEHITPEAQKAIRESDVIVGYSTYLALIQDIIKNKEVISTGMTQEVDRCKKAVEFASTGKTVAVISGGDPGIYAMAGLVFEILRGEGVKESRGQALRKTERRLSNPRTLESSNPIVEVIPGIPAVNACAAKLGAPLMHDFACISLSDRLTPWDLIEKRLEAAAKADFVIVLYNPKSKGRVEQIKKTREIVLRHRIPGTPVGIVRGVTRSNEEIIITNLKDMLDYEVDMQTTVIIGNSQTFTWGKWMITPRGYGKKFKVKS
ncbi:MAG: bifunctional cobalt-precorrin 5A hydrolase/precorrin-3B C(17)-methyltransferase [Nitrospirae bacterium]|nr:bifunctional cobalt-precorrin 5A hydrolase/precorrin-3B C(17)-methyltransferase [Nitrospirota bacterium]